MQKWVSFSVVSERKIDSDTGDLGYRFVAVGRVITPSSSIKRKSCEKWSSAITFWLRTMISERGTSDTVLLFNPVWRRSQIGSSGEEKTIVGLLSQQ